MNRNKIIFSVLKEIEKGNFPNHDDYNITKEQYGEIVEMMLDDNLIKKAIVKRAGIGLKVLYIYMDQAKITSDGIKFLSENTKWAKTYKGLKEVRDWIPGY